MSGFTFNGQHCERDLRVKYAPTEEERAGFFAKFSIQDKSFDTKDGGLYYNTTLKTLEMEMPCFYEELTKHERERVIRWLEHGQRGRLVFDDRPFCYYDVVTGAQMEIREYPVRSANGTTYSGIFTITFIAYDPSARLFEQTADSDDDTGLYDTTDAIPASKMPAAPTVDSESFLVYNPGTRRCGLILKVAGDTGSESVTFHNEATGQDCSLIGLTGTQTTLARKWVEVDGDTMQVFWKGDATSEIDYSFHDDGYISLEPAMPVVKEVPVTYNSGSGTVHSNGGFTSQMAGQYMQIGGDWRHITFVRSPDEAEVVWQPSEDGSEKAIIATLNRITVTKGEGVTLTKLEIDYHPKVR